MDEYDINRQLLLEHDYRVKLTRYTDDLRTRAVEEKTNYFSTLRNMPLDIVKSSGMFYIDSMTEMLLPDYLDDLVDFGVISSANNKPIFNRRWVIPIRDRDGLVSNLVGYSNEANERYIYGTAKYYRRRDTLYGLENLNLAYKLGYAIRTEGITDTMRLRSLGYLNTFAMCGTHKSDYINTMFNRLRYGVIDIPDRDKPGKQAERGWVTNRYIILRTPIMFKDSDEMLKSGEHEGIFRDYMAECIRYITAQEHNGVIYPVKEYTII